MKHRIWAYVAAAWAIIFAAPHVYWATGGTWGLRTALADEIVSDADGAFQVLNAGIAVFCLTGALVALATLWTWPARPERLARRTLVGLVWFGAVLLLARSVDIYVEFNLNLTGIRDVAPERREEFIELARWFMFLWLPWFASGAVAWTGLAWRLVRPPGQPGEGRPWQGSPAPGVRWTQATTERLAR